MASFVCSGACWDCCHISTHSMVSSTYSVHVSRTIYMYMYSICTVHVHCNISTCTIRSLNCVLRL